MFLHIGHSKVGSSSLQAFLSRNIDKVRKQGFLVANGDGTLPKSGPCDANPLDVLQSARDEGPDAQRLFHDHFQRLHADL